MAAIAKCVTSCKESTMGSELKVTERILMENINEARYYDYLQYMYYQVTQYLQNRAETNINIREYSIV